MGATTAPEGAATVRRFYELAGAGRFEEAVLLLDDDLVIHEPVGLPYGGEYHGVEGYREIMARIVDRFEIGVVGTPRISGTGDPVVIRMVGRFSAPSTGRSVEMDITELFRVRDGRIVEMDVYYKDPEAVAGLLDA